MYPPAGIFASPPFATEGAHLPRPRPLRGVTSAGKEIIYLSSEESVGSSNEELSSWSKIFAGVLRDLGIDPEEKKTKKVATKKSAPKKKVNVEAGATSKQSRGADISQKGTLRFRQSNLEDYIVASDSLEDLSRVGKKSKSSVAAASKSSGSAGSRATESGATPSSLHEEEEEEVEEEGVQLVVRKRSREEAAATTPPTQKVVAAKPIGKQGRLRSLYKFSPEALKKPEVKTKGPEAKKTKFTIIPLKIIPEKEVEKRVEDPAGNVMP
ncbi:hypothetical protein HanRHA438_Chr11g0501471 [Helianthus annuus]|uniref:Uncharacterized protein n=1 Tax=Helianthus annuus TaxID=4232 RepID=A0A9K3MZU4_HELAN|nr:hypothetical protein HanXRQr2_Chr11g0488651 [Helianthus annuus]KAJ0501398.1 hypothetical protein HanHA300_Chr11g0400361 [Helianthus annuus]KAJ0509193.1 hypothetical protein HanIR_Chr11g0526061 [Helianthus annuus]KAJ0517306.1 hypothetical protein HanHA89_Chr11g0423881 [Helianthus annuus]KAJ0685317.1 hypothetical protein HanLR1_Chr11g0401331 [Helianthus annuus]